MVYNKATLEKVSKADSDLFQKAARIIGALCDWNDNVRRTSDRLDFECHSICMAIKELEPRFTVVHGCYVGVRQIWRKGKLVDWKVVTSDHSWLKTPNGNIIDPHPVGIISATPLIVIGKGKISTFGSGLYVAGHINSKRYKNKKVRGQVRALCAFLRRRHVPFVT